MSGGICGYHSGGTPGIVRMGLGMLLYTCSAWDNPPQKMTWPRVSREGRRWLRALGLGGSQSSRVGMQAGAEKGLALTTHLPTAAPPVPELPLRHCVGEQCRGLHQEELP